MRTPVCAAEISHPHIRRVLRVRCGTATLLETDEAVSILLQYILGTTNTSVHDKITRWVYQDLTYISSYKYVYSYNYLLLNNTKKCGQAKKTDGNSSFFCVLRKWRLLFPQRTTKIFINVTSCYYNLIKVIPINKKVVKCGNISSKFFSTLRFQKSSWVSARIFTDHGRDFPSNLPLIIYL